MNWRRWNWLDDGILPLLVTTVRLAWIWPWLELLRRWLTPDYPHGWLPLWSIFFLFIAGLAVTRSIVARTPDLRTARLWVALSGLAVILALLVWRFGSDPLLASDRDGISRVAHILTEWRFGPPIPLLALFVAAGVWMRGQMDARYRRTRDDVWATCVTGFAAFALLALAAQADPNGLPANAGGWLIVLITASLSALALASLELSRSISVWGEERGTRPAMSRDWLLGVGLVIVAMLLLGLGLGALFTPDAVAGALGWVGVVFRWIGVLLGYVVIGIVYVLFFFLQPLIDWLQAQMANREPEEMQPAESIQSQFEELVTGPAAELSPAAAETLRWLGVVGVLILIGVVFALALRYFRAERSDDPDETRETILTRDLVEDQLASLWRQLLARLRRPLTRVRSPFLVLDGEHEHRRAIRGLYQLLLARTKTLGAAHTPPQTPAEYQVWLTRRWPAAATTWQALTEEYVAARYGLLAPDVAQVERAQAAWTAADQVLVAKPDAG